MRRFNRPLVVAVVLAAAATVAALPAYASDSPAPSGTEHTEPVRPTTTEPDHAKVACTADELAAFLAHVKAEHASHDAGTQHVDAPGDGAAQERAHAAERLARACAAAKQHAADEAKKAAEKAKKEADRKARARQFEAVGVVDVIDGTAGTVTVFVVRGNPDLRSRKLPIKVTDGTVIKLDGAKAALANLVSGMYVNVHGVRTDGGLVADRITAETPRATTDPAPTAPATTEPARI